MSSQIKCLMIGQVGIGKTTFLENFPNIKKNEENLENFSYETFNNKCENVNIEIDVYDITLETCLNDTDLIVNNKIIPSNQFINIGKYNCIILCFAMDDPSSFQLIKSKWEIDLKRNKRKQNGFVLLGLKSDTVLTSNDDAQVERKNVLTARNSFKKRSCSVNSNSSTSKFAKHNRNEILHNENDLQQVSINVYKKFSKLIGSVSFIQYSSLIENVNQKKTKCPLNAYEKFVKNILSKDYTKVHEVKENGKAIIPKSISTPINNLVNRKSRKEKNELRPLNSVHFENTSFINLNGEETRALPVMKPSKTSEPLSIKSKLSRLAFGIGTYIVTCGSAQSRRLANFKSLDKNKSKLAKKNKSWLLLASEMSLNNLDNE